MYFKSYYTYNRYKSVVIYLYINSTSMVINICQVLIYIHQPINLFNWHDNVWLLIGWPIGLINKWWHVSCCNGSYQISGMSEINTSTILLNNIYTIKAYSRIFVLGRNKHHHITSNKLYTTERKLALTWTTGKQLVTVNNEWLDCMLLWIWYCSFSAVELQ